MNQKNNELREIARLWIAGMAMQSVIQTSPGDNAPIAPSSPQQTAVTARQYADALLAELGY